MLNVKGHGGRFTVSPITVANITYTCPILRFEGPLASDVITQSLAHGERFYDNTLASYRFKWSIIIKSGFFFIMKTTWPCMKPMCYHIYIYMCVYIYMYISRHNFNYEISVWQVKNKNDIIYRLGAISILGLEFLLLTLNCFLPREFASIELSLYIITKITATVKNNVNEFKKGLTVTKMNSFPSTVTNMSRRNGLSLVWLISLWRCINASVNQVRIGLDNGLSQMLGYCQLGT